LEVEEVMAAAAASSLEELAEDLERIGVASSTEEDSSLDETDIDMLVDADLDKVPFTHSSWCFYAVFCSVVDPDPYLCFGASRIGIRIRKSQVRIRFRILPSTSRKSKKKP
jgi:hypothetical protein